MHTKTNINKIIKGYLIALIPLLIYGFYKNGFIVYNRGLINTINLLKILLLPILGIVIPIIIDYFYALSNNIKPKHYIKNSFSIIYSLIYTCILPSNINIIAYIISLILLIYLLNEIPMTKFKLNTIVLIKLIIIFILFLLNKYTYLNTYESNIDYSYTLFNNFFGRNIGGFGTTNIFLILCSYIGLSFTESYKKEIPLIIIIFSIISSIIISLIFKDNIMSVLKNLLISNIFFTSIFIATIPMFSPYTKEGSIIFAILTGILNGICIKFISFQEGAYISLLISTSLITMIDFIILKIKE